ncbi:MAG TPA: tetratricopeptide repeat protein [Acidobacteriaceae bacterium]|nr:tetratricopeptide repeat protein [Acidobacteriaceae bacterium]
MHVALPFDSSRLKLRSAFAALLLATIAAPLLGAGQAADPPEQREAGLYEDGMRLLHEKNYAQALERFQALERAAPNLPQGYTGEGIALALTGRMDDAIPALRKALAIDPSYWIAERELGILDWQKGRRAEAAKELTGVVKFAPGDISVNTILGEYNFEERNYSEAVRFFSAAQARVELSVPLSLLYFEAMIKSGQSQQAAEELGRLAAAPSLDPQQRFRTAWLLGEAGAYSKAIEVFTALPPDVPDAFDRGYGIALAYYEEGKYADCIQGLLALKQRGIARAELFSLLGSAQERSGHPAQAKEAFQEGIQDFPKGEDNYLNRAILAVRDQEYPAATDLLTAGLQQLPGNYKLSLTRGVVYTLQGNLHKAQADYEKAVSLAPDEASVYLGLGICLMDQNQYPAAADTFRSAIQKGLADAKLNYFLVDTLFRQGLTASSPLYQEALRTVDAAIQLSPDYPYTYLQRGKLLLMTHHLQEAIGDLEHARKLDPDSTTVAYQLATAYRTAGRTAEADKLFAQVAHATALQDAEFRQSTLMRVVGAVSDAHYSEK